MIKDVCYVYGVGASKDTVSEILNEAVNDSYRNHSLNPINNHINTITLIKMLLRTLTHIYYMILVYYYKIT